MSELRRDPDRRRTDRRRARERRVMGVSLAVAALVHVAAFVFLKWDRSGHEWTPDRSAVELESGSWTGTRISVLFGPPSILHASGRFVEEPVDRILEAVRVMQAPPLCLGRQIPPAAPGLGEVRLTINAEGRVDAARLSRSTGDPCWDEIAIRVAGDLLYRWLPGAHAVPLELRQPLTVGLDIE